MKRLLYFFTFSLLCALAGAGQIVTTQPAIVQTDSRDIVITFHAAEGNGALKGLAPDVAVYAHTGVILKGSADWKHAPAWLDNAAKYKLTYVAPDTYTLEIPSIDSYYGISASEPEVERLAFVFRDANGSRQGKTATGGDIFIDVQPAGYKLAVSSSLADNVALDDSEVEITASVTSASSIRMYESGSDKPFASVENAMTLTGRRSFAEAGEHEIIVEATDGTNTLKESIVITRLASSEQRDYPGGVPVAGAVENADGSVTFCLPAPGKSNVVMVPSWKDYEVSSDMQMAYQDYEGARYFWITVDGLEKDTDYIYYYLIDGVRKVGDPYAHLVLDWQYDKYIPASVFPGMPEYPADKVQDVPLAVYRSDSSDFAWEIEEFKGVAQSDLMIYEILIRDFTGAEGKANAEGTVKGVVEKLDYIKSLGVNAIELMPVMEFNGNNSWGYNTNFYFAPDKAYGTPDDYRTLVDEAHKRGLAVILDIVFNQSDWLHPWYKMYDIAENPFYNGSAPHDYSVLNDWNQDNPLVQKQWEDALAYWMTEYKVDGFRFDLVKGLGDNDSYGNTYDAATNMWGKPSAANTDRYNATRVARMKRLHESMKKVNPDAYFINENLATAQEENEMASDGEINWANINNSSCQFAMGYQSDASLNRFYAPLDNREWGSTVSYAESHDEERMAYKQDAYGASGVKGNREMSVRRLSSVAAQMILSPGAHMIWQFQELGANQTTKNSSGNDTGAKKVVWSLLDNPLNAALKDCYATLCDIRTSNPELFSEEAQATVNLSGWDAGRTLVLASGSKKLLLVVNPQTSGEKTIGYSEDLSTYSLLSVSPGVAPKVDGSKVTLPAGAYAVYGNSAVSAIDEIIPEASAVTVYSADGTIYVEGEYRSASVYNLSGHSVGFRNLPRGIYVVRVDDKAFKVRVD